MMEVIEKELEQMLSELELCCELVDMLSFSSDFTLECVEVHQVEQ